MRKGNLEFRKCSYLGEPPEHIGWEICQWAPNSYYGRESEFIKDGEFYRPNDDKFNFVRIHKNCFKNPEVSWQIASFDYNDHEGCYEFSFCGDRPLSKDIDWELFKEFVQYGFNKLNCNDNDDGSNEI